MTRRMSATQLLDAAETCVTCGKIHKLRKLGSYVTYQGADGHPYRTRIYEMSGRYDGPTLAALRQIAANSTESNVTGA